MKEKYTINRVTDIPLDVNGTRRSSKTIKDLKKSFLLIAVGLFNIIHSSMHIIQFVQSMLLVHNSITEHNHDNILDKILHNPFFGLFWGVVGVVTLIVGIKDYFHHKKCN